MTDAMVTSQLSRTAGQLQGIAEGLDRYPVSERTEAERLRLARIIDAAGFEVALVADAISRARLPDCPAANQDDQQGHSRCSVA